MEDNIAYHKMSKQIPQTNKQAVALTTLCDLKIDEFLLINLLSP
jgi:hypothetical protein